MKKLFLSITATGLYLLVYAQNPAAIAFIGGEVEMLSYQCITDAELLSIQEKVKNNISLLEKQGLLIEEQRNQVLLEWPLKLAPGAPDLPYYVTGNQVDQNWNAGALLDYNCGNRTYDGHTGVDIGLWPFWWKKMADEEVDVIAAAEGVIIEKHDGEYDQNCGGSQGGVANYVILMHPDFSKTWYYHLKKGTVTNKPVGASVSTGEFLGKVGSSGYSSAPHLHFSLEIDGIFVDPYEGPCNGFSSSWIDQRPYYEPTLHLVATHQVGSIPEFPPCPMQELPNIHTEFKPGDYVIFSAFYHDQQPGDLVYHKITRPDNSVFVESVQTMGSYMHISYYYGNHLIPIDAPTGIWKYCATYHGKTVCAEFNINSMTPTTSAVQPKVQKMLSVHPNPSGETITVSNVSIGKTVFVKDLLGRVVITQHAASTTTEVDFSHLANGIYFVQNGNQIIRVMKGG